MLHASNPAHTSRSSSDGPPFFTFEKQAASLSDLEIVRKIVEREGCLEALQQLLSNASDAATTRKSVTRAPSSEIEEVYPYTYPQKSMATTSPMVFQSLLEQLRSVTVQIIEAIDQWRANNQMQVFQWRQINYLLKMTSDLDFLASMAPAVARVDALRNVRLERNPFLATLHLDHPALREKTPDAAVLLGLWVDNVDMRRVFYGSKVLLRELEMEQKKQKLALGTADEDESFGDPLPAYDLGRAMSVMDLSMKEEMRRDLELSRELILHAEHELGAIREEVAILQEKLAEALTRPERRRKLQNKIGGLVNTLKFKTGDLYQRKNELRRKEAAFKAKGIDGALLLQATDRDLEELGVSLRLHRVRILEAVKQASKEHVGDTSEQS